MTVEKKQLSLFKNFLWLGNTIFHQIVAIVTVFIFWVCFKAMDINSTILWHIILSTGAYVPLMAEGVILFYGENVWSRGIDRTKRYWIHGPLLLTSVVCLTIGISLEINSREQRGSSHFVTDHSKTGLASWILGFLSVILGLFSWNAQGLKSLARPVIFKFCHNFLGIACYTIGIASLVLGLYKGVFANNVTQWELDATIWLVCIITVWSLLAAVMSAFNQLKTIFT